MKFIEERGMQYATEKSKTRHRYGLYQCPECLAEVEMVISDVKYNKTKSCKRCSSKKKSSIHGLYKHKLYPVWVSQKGRCENVNNKNYSRYGGRGIKFSDELRDFDVWLNFVESLDNAYKNKYSLDRIDNDGNYEVGNLRWASLEVQHSNTTKIKSTNTSGYRGVSYNKRDNKWLSQINTNKKHKYLGQFDYPWAAAYAYDAYVLKNNLEHTRNF